MAEIAVFASGTGSNFSTIAEDFATNNEHSICALVCDRKQAPVLQIASQRQIPIIYSSYFKRSRREAEEQIINQLHEYKPKLLVLAGFMRLLSPHFIQSFNGNIINIHPSLLPRHPGADAIHNSWISGDNYLGISIHWVDEGMDTGSIIVQQAFHRSEVENLQQAEARIHELEHFWYPKTIRSILDQQI